VVATFDKASGAIRVAQRPERDQIVQFLADEVKPPFRVSVCARTVFGITVCAECLSDNRWFMTVFANFELVDNELAADFVEQRVQFLANRIGRIEFACERFTRGGPTPPSKLIRPSQILSGFTYSKLDSGFPGLGRQSVLLGCFSVLN